jgi:hypothetical protein
MDFKKLKPYDEIIITGTASNPHGVQFIRLRAGVATISNDGYIKVWQISDNIEYDNIWFKVDEITDLEILL